MTNMEATKTKEEVIEHLLDYVAYTLTSAKGLYREPQSYGAMRMVDAMERALRLLKEVGIEDEVLEDALSAVRKDRWRAMTDKEGFGKAIDDSILNLVNIK
ncbi:hypothetical protein G3A_07115 [Bacillus sp. 17376]|uniref:Uncharacterized protein n=1 Tax=Mesobacillus boroniphilus JCM 21738 TaxID=1294265 RepID=W4RPE1_9BACI|nr:DUF6092 family protein [Mesobacillus boroniphilus]ESU33281.1 hypothetical protein G3A_07115 [Bacillus sp. 17376]GAE46191.1 hypothetical protein JCM21738_3068 [Mesobacillus boroniphilus JCM 21738]